MASDFSSECNDAIAIFDDEKEEGEISLDDVSSSEEGHTNYRCMEKIRDGRLHLQHQAPCEMSSRYNSSKLPYKKDAEQGKENHHLIKGTGHSGDRLTNSTLQEKNDDLIPISSDSDMELVGLPKRVRRAKSSKVKKKKKKRKPHTSVVEKDDESIANEIDENLTIMELNNSTSTKENRLLKTHHHYHHHREKSPTYKMKISPKKHKSSLIETRLAEKKIKSLIHKSIDTRKRLKKLKTSEKIVHKDLVNPLYKKIRNRSSPSDHVSCPSTDIHVTSLLKKVRHYEMVGTLEDSKISSKTRDHGSSLKEKLNNILKPTSENNDGITKETENNFDKKKNETGGEEEEDLNILRQKALETKQNKTSKSQESINIDEEITENPCNEMEVKNNSTEEEVTENNTNEEQIKGNTNNEDEDDEDDGNDDDDDDEDLKLRLIALRSAVFKKHRDRMAKLRKDKEALPPRSESPFNESFINNISLAEDVDECPSNSSETAKDSNNSIEDMELDSDIECDIVLEKDVNSSKIINSEKFDVEKNENSQKTINFDEAPYSPTDDVNNELILEAEQLGIDTTDVSLININSKNFCKFGSYLPISNKEKTPPIENNYITISGSSTNSDVDIMSKNNHDRNSNFERPYSPSDAPVFDPDLTDSLLIPINNFSETLNNKNNSDNSDNSISLLSQSSKEPEVILIDDDLPETDIDGSPLVPMERDTNVQYHIPEHLSYQMLQPSYQPLYLKNLHQDIHGIPPFVHNPPVRPPALRINQQLQQSSRFAKEMPIEKTYKSSSVPPMSVELIPEHFNPSQLNPTIKRPIIDSLMIDQLRTTSSDIDNQQSKENFSTNRPEIESTFDFNKSRKKLRQRRKRPNLIECEEINLESNANKILKKITNSQDQNSESVKRMKTSINQMSSSHEKSTNYDNKSRIDDTLEISVRKNVEDIFRKYTENVIRECTEYNIRKDVENIVRKCTEHIVRENSENNFKKSGEDFLIKDSEYSSRKDNDGILRRGTEKEAENRTKLQKNSSTEKDGVQENLEANLESRRNSVDEDEDELRAILLASMGKRTKSPKTDKSPMVTKSNEIVTNKNLSMPILTAIPNKSTEITSKPTDLNSTGNSQVKSQSAKVLLSKETSNKSLPTKEISAKSLPTKETPVKILPSKETLVMDSSGKKVVPVKNIPPKETLAKDLPTKETSAKVLPTKVVPEKVLATTNKVLPTVSPIKNLPDKISPAKLLSAKVLPTEVSTTKVSPVNVSSPKVSPQKVLSAKSTPQKVLSTKVTSQKVLPSKVPQQKISPTKVVSKINPTKITPAKTLSNKVLSTKITINNSLATNSILGKRKANSVLLSGTPRKFMRKTMIPASTKVVNNAKRYQNSLMQRKINLQKAILTLNAKKIIASKSLRVVNLNNQNSRSLSPSITSANSSERFIISLNSDSESDSESERRNTIVAVTNNSSVEKHPPLKIPTTEFERSVDQFLRDVRKRQESAAAKQSTNSSLSKTLPPTEKTTITPLAVRHLPVSQQEEYHRLKQQIVEREKLKLQRSTVSGSTNTVIPPDPPATIGSTPKAISPSSPATNDISKINLHTKSPEVDNPSSTNSPDDTLALPIKPNITVQISNIGTSPKKSVTISLPTPNLIEEKPKEPTFPKLRILTCEQINLKLFQVQVSQNDEGRKIILDNNTNEEQISLNTENLDDSVIILSEKMSDTGDNSETNLKKRINMETPNVALSKNSTTLACDNTTTINNTHKNSKNEEEIPVSQVSTQNTVVKDPKNNNTSKELNTAKKSKEQTTGKKLIAEKESTVKENSIPTKESITEKEITASETSSAVEESIVTKESIVSKPDESVNKETEKSNSKDNKVPGKEKGQQVWDVIKNNVQTEVETVAKLGNEEMKRKLVETEQELVSKRYEVLDDLAEVSKSLRQWELEKDLQSNLTDEVKKLVEQLRVTEEKLQEQKDKVTNMGLKVSTVHEKMNIGRKECFRLSKICTGLGNRIYGQKYKVPESGVQLVNNRLKEVAQHTSQLCKKKNNKRQKISATSTRTNEKESDTSSQIIESNSPNSIQAANSTGSNQITNSRNTTLLQPFYENISSPLERQNSSESISSFGKVSSSSKNHGTGEVVRNENVTLDVPGCSKSINSISDNVSQSQVKQTNEAKEKNPSGNNKTIDSSSRMENNDESSVTCHCGESSVPDQINGADIQTKKKMRPYVSILDHMKTAKNSRSDGILCPYQLMGSCQDADCQYVHHTPSH